MRHHTSDSDRGGGLGGRNVGSKWSDSGFLLPIKLIGFADGLDEQSEEKRVIKKKSPFRLSKRINGSAIF